MSQVAVEKVGGKKAAATSVFEEMKAISERIRQRAFEIFERRGGGHGFAENDWANAERDLFSIPQAELIEKDGAFKINVSAPGFDPDDVRVMALPDALLIRASSAHEHKGKEGNVLFCEFDQKKLFRRFDLPDPINIDKVSATLDKGVLQVTAIKAKQHNAKKAQTVAA